MADSHVQRVLHPALLGLVGFYLFLALQNLLVWASDSRIPAVLAAVATAAALFVLTRLARPGTSATGPGRDPSPARATRARPNVSAHAVGLAAGLLVLAHTLLWMSREPLADPATRLSLLLVGAGLVFVSYGWLTVLVAVVWSVLVGVAATSESVGLPDNAVLTLLAATATALVVQRFRQRSVARLLDLEQAAAADRQAREVSEERYRLAAEGSTDGLYDWDLRTGTMFYSPRLQTLMGVESEVTPASWMERIHPDDHTRVLSGLEAHWRGETTQFAEEHRIRQPDGTWRWVLARGASQRDGQGRAVRMAGSVTDLSTRGLFDPLTGLPNRRLLIDRLERALAGRTRDGGDFSVLFVDLDRFKLVNDTLGHPAGDALLVEAAARIQTCVRASDTVARLGGDEFVVLLERVDVPDGVVVTIDRIQSRLAESVRVGGRDLHVRASVGAVMDTREYDDPLDLLRDADTAMYEAKQRGDPWAVFDLAMRQRLSERLSLEAELHMALRCEQFVVHYQPIVDMDSERVIGYEALVRWEHPERGLVPPGVFIEVMEETGLILELGEWVLRTACREIMTAFPGTGADLPSVSVNVSRRQLRPTFAQEVKALLDEVGFDPQRLKLEITETAILQQPEFAVETLRQLRALGIQIMMDDFGTGHSSLGVLQVLPIDQLKIDRSFIHRIGDDAQAAEMVRAIIAMGRGLGLRIVAEGVETPTQLDSLRSFDCDLGQGFLFARPAELPALLRLQPV